MRKLVLAIVSGSLALAAGISAAQAEKIESTTLSLDSGTFFTPSQFDVNGDVYGVRANVAANTDRPDVMAISSPTKAAAAPGPCATAGFPGGWCNTARGIATSAFGFDPAVAKGAGVIVGVVDTGIDINHPDFAGRILPGTCIVTSGNPCNTAYTQVGGDEDIYPSGDDTHGTHVAGIIAGSKTGLAQSAHLLPVKVCGDSGCNNVTEGMLYAAQHGASIMNVSIGGPFISQSEISDLRDVASLGALMVVSAGNSGSNPTSGFIGSAAIDPGVYGSMLVVGATGCNGSATGTNCANNGHGGISTFGQTPGNRCQVSGGHSYCMRDVFVMAPGVDIWSTVGNGSANTGATYGYLSGTSMAAPYVTGIAALVKGQNKKLTAQQIATIIITTADDVGAPGHDAIYGAGFADAARATAPIGTAAPNNLVQAVNGQSQATIATSGANAATARGVQGALTSVLNGPLSGALANSSLLKNALLLDAYGRPYTMDLTKTIDNRSASLANIFLADGSVGFSPFAMAMDMPAGKLMVSGLGMSVTTPSITSGMYLQSDRKDYQVRDLLIDAPLTARLSMSAGYNVDSLGGVINQYDANSSVAYSGLFMDASAVNSPYVSLTNGGSFLGSTVALADDLHFSFTQSLMTPDRGEFMLNPYSTVTQLMGTLPLYDQRSANATVASMNWDIAKWAGLGLTASQTSERNGLLGGLTAGALDLSNSANTTAVGVSARVGFGDGWVTTASYSEGITQLDLKPNAGSLISSSTDLRSRSYGVAVAKHGLFGDNDSLGFAVSRPIHVYSGSANLNLATSVDEDGNLTYGAESLALGSKTPETDVELGYVTTFLDGSLALQTNAAYQVNLAGQSGKNALAVVSRAKINF